MRSDAPHDAPQRLRTQDRPPVRRTVVAARAIVRVVALALAVTAVPSIGATSARAEDAPSAAAEPSWLVLDAPDLRIRRTMAPNAVVARYLLDADAPAPRAGDEVVGERGVPVRWTPFVPAAEGGGAIGTQTTAWAHTTVESPSDRVVLAGLRGAPLRGVGGGAIGPQPPAGAHTTVESPSDRVVFAELRGAAILWVNGEPAAGDVYGYGLGGFPVVLRKGTNRILVGGLRGAFRLAFHAPPPGAAPVGWDVVRPDVVRGADATAAVSVVVVGAAPAERRDVAFRVFVDGATLPAASGRVALAPLQLGRCTFEVAVPASATADPARTGVPLTVETSADGVTSRLDVVLDVRAPGEARRVTFRSRIDGSLQQYAVLPPADGPPAAAPRIVMSLHGAGVDCLGQARSYSLRPGVWVVCPTNRRPFGFDWQDWGRRDAYEVLEHALAWTGADAARVALTGHSMGGHGTWHLAANDPDRFVAIAPSAGWASFDTYAGGPRPPSALSPLWRGADGASDTLALVRNLAQVPTFVLHGTADDNVPASEAERMLAALRAAGASPASHLQAGGGHWWDGDAAPGADCVDWPGIFDHFARAASGGVDAGSIDWTTVDPSVDAEHAGWRIVQPLLYGRPARLLVTRAPGGAEPLVETTNVRRLARREGAAWREVGVGSSLLPPLDPVREKTPERSGPLKRAFERDVVAVLPTRAEGRAATSATTSAAAAHAQFRIDAGQWWVRANALLPSSTDLEFEGGDRAPGRNVLLYGNADTNAAWARLVGERSPVEVAEGRVRVGDRVWRGDGIACFFVRPRADDAEGLVGVLGSTGVRGARLAATHTMFTSGTGWPDYVVWDERALALGDGGVLAAGWFGATWELDGLGHAAWGGDRAPAAPGAGGSR